jgi:hypothetical protein
VAGVLGDIGQFIVERCDQHELLLYFRILHLTRDGANRLRFLPIILSLVCWQSRIHCLDDYLDERKRRLAEHFCRRRSGVSIEGV